VSFSRIAISSTRDNPPPADPRIVVEIYLADPGVVILEWESGPHAPDSSDREHRRQQQLCGGVAEREKDRLRDNRLRAEEEPLLTSDL